MIVVAFRLQEYTVQLTAARGRDSQEVTANTTSTLHEHERPRTNTVAAEVTWFKRSVCVCVCVCVCADVVESESKCIHASECECACACMFPRRLCGPSAPDVINKNNLVSPNIRSYECNYIFNEIP